MTDHALDRLNELITVFDEMTNLGIEATINQFDEFQFEIHSAIARLKQSGLRMRQIVPLVAPAVRVLVRTAVLAQELEDRSISTQPHGFRELTKSSFALLEMIEAYESGEKILFSDETKLANGEDSSSTDSRRGVGV